MAQDPWNDWLRDQNNGNTGIGNTGRPPGSVQSSLPNPPQPGGAMWDGVQIGSPEYVSKIEQQLKTAGGSMYDPTDLEGFIRNSTNNQGTGWAGSGNALQSQLDIYKQRAASNGGPGSGGAGQAAGMQMPGAQFDDAYSNLLENIAKKQMGEVRSNPGLDSLLGFLTKQFQDLSTNPGYNPAEQAMLNTQAFEPIEANRQASMQRARERAGARGFAPSSGLMELDLRDVERSADQARTVAGRDLAIAGLDRRDRDLSRALDLGQMLGLDIPRQQRGEEIGLGNLLYQMPRTALQDALSVISGTPSSTDAFSQAIQLLQQQYAQQGRSDANNAALYGQIGQILAGLFR